MFSSRAYAEQIVCGIVFWAIVFAAVVLGIEHAGIYALKHVSLKLVLK
jgi:hypothetical protein